MLTEFILKNFQIHKNKKITFTEGVNFILGNTDSGKSAILRALILLLTGSPRAGHIKYKNKQGKGDLILEAVTSKGNKIKKVNKYYYINDNTNPIKGFGTELPEIIKEICPIEAVNIQKQMEPYFIMLDSGNSAAKRINKYTGIEDYDKLQSIIKSEISRINNDIKRTIEENAQITEKIKDEKVIKILYKHGEKIEKELTSIEQNKKQLNIFNQKLAIAYTHQEKVKNIPLIEKYITQLQEILIDLKTIKEERQKLQTFDYKLKQIKILKHKIKQRAMVDNFIIKLQNIAQKLQNMYEEEKALLLFSKQLNKANNLKNKIKKLKTEIDKIQEQLSKVKICPLCKQTLKKGTFM